MHMSSRTGKAIHSFEASVRRGATIGAAALGAALLAVGCQTSQRSVAVAAPVMQLDDASSRPVVTLATNFPAAPAVVPVAPVVVPVLKVVPAATPVAVPAVAVPVIVSAPVAATPAPAAAAVATVRPALYVVKDGDTLSQIAEKYLDGASHWPEIVAANPGLVPEKLRTGRTIHLPPVTSVTAPAAAPVVAPIVAPAAAPVVTPVAAPAAAK